MLLVDSDIVIGHLRGVSPARVWLREARQGDDVSVSAVTVAEVTGGMRSSERRDVWALLASLPVESVDESVARRAGEFARRYRRSHANIGLGDYLIAATADVRGLELKTLNVKHFPMFPRLRPAFQL